MQQHSASGVDRSSDSASITPAIADPLRILAVSLNPALDVSCSADSVHATRKIRANEQQVHPGGGGINVARVLVELGHRPALVYLRGGATGRMIDAALAQLDLTLYPVRRISPTRIAFTAHERSSGLEFRFVPDGDAVSNEELAAAFDRVEAVESDILVISGSMPPGSSDSALLDLIERCGAVPCRVIVDTSGAPLQAVLHAEGVGLFLVKPSLGELESVIGHRLDECGIERAAQALVKSGAASHVVVSLGAQGALLAYEDRIIRAVAPRVTVRSACGAGDAFLAGMVHGFAYGEDATGAFRYGLAAGAAAVMTRGTVLCRRDDVERLHRHLAERNAAGGTPLRASVD